MSGSSVTEDIIARHPPQARAIIRLLRAPVAELNAQVDRSHARIEELEAKVEQLQRETKGKTRRNSSLPPSTQYLHARPQPPQRKSKRGCGGQPGHPKHEQELMPTDQCHHVEACKPDECRRCGTRLLGSDPEPLQHELWEVLEIKAEVTSTSGIG